MSKDNHGFSVSVACKVGVPGAIVLQHLCFLQKNLIAPNENWQEKWVKRSAQAMTVAYPYWSAKQIRTILDNLESDGYSLSKIENENRYDRSKSYILTKSGAELLGEKWEIAFSEKENESDQMEKEDLPNGQMIIKEGCNSFVPSFVEEKAASLFPSPETENQPLEASKKTPPPSSAPPPTLAPPFTPVGTIEPQPATIVRMYSPEHPDISIVTSVPGTYETKRGKKPARNEPHVHTENEPIFSHFTEPERAKAFWSEWLKYKWGEHRQRYKTPLSELTSLRKLWKMSGGQTETAGQIIEQSVANLWHGLFELKTEKKNGQQLNKAQQQHASLAAFLVERRQRAMERGDFFAVE